MAPQAKSATVSVRFTPTDPQDGGCPLFERFRHVLKLTGLVSFVGGVLCLAGAPAQAVDLVPFVGLRFGGDVGTTTQGALGPTSVTLDSSASYGGVLDVPLSGPRSVELYYSRQQTTLGSPGVAEVHDVTMSVLHLGLVDAYATDNPQLSWLLIGTVGASQLSAAGSEQTKPSIGLGGGVVWMASEHIGVRGDLRALLTFSGNGGGAIACGGGCSISFHGSLVAQGEASVGLLVRF